MSKPPARGRAWKPTRPVTPRRLARDAFAHAYGSRSVWYNWRLKRREENASKLVGGIQGGQGPEFRK